MQIFKNKKLSSVAGLSNLSHFAELLLVKENPGLRNVRGLGGAIRASKSKLADIDIYTEVLGKIDKVHCLDLDCLLVNQAIDDTEELGVRYSEKDQSKSEL